MTDLSGSDTESFFDAFGLGVAYRKPGDKSSKKARINSALHQAEVKQKRDTIMDEAARHFGWTDLLIPVGEQRGHLLSEQNDADTAGGAAGKPGLVPQPRTPEQRALLQEVWDRMVATTAWPQFDIVDRALDSRHGIDAVEVARTLPLGLLYPPHPDGHRRDEQLRLSPAGLAACRGSEEVLAAFLAALRLAARLEREFGADGLGESGSDPVMGASHVRAMPEIPAAGRDHIVALLGLCLGAESWGWSSHASMTEDGQWSFVLSRTVRRFGEIESLDDYWRLAHLYDVRPPKSPLIQPADDATTNPEEDQPMAERKSIFLVHGHSEVRHEVARFLEKVTANTHVIVLSELASRSRTLVEKFEAYGDEASYAVVLMTPDDFGRTATGTEEQGRARQNVIFELGYFFGKLGRDRVAVLRQSPIEKPSDIDGIVYIDLGTSSWQLELSRDLRDAGFEVDLLR